ncbi:MAG: CAP domain-containing protein [Actinomycetota bacterium]
MTAGPGRAPLASILALLLLAGAVFSLPRAEAQPSDFDERLIELVNDWRASRGLDRLISHDPLSGAAQSWSTFMAGGSPANCSGSGSRWGHSNHPFGHPANPPGTTGLAENIVFSCGFPGTFFAKTWSTALGPLPSYCAPSMDYSTPEMLICLWLTSPGHRSTIETASYTHMGSGTASLSAANGGVERFATHLFSRSAVPEFDPSCDGQLNITDALMIAQFDVGLRASVGSCAITNAATQMNAAKADVNRDGAVSIVDALFVAQCVVGSRSC